MHHSYDGSRSYLCAHIHVATCICVNLHTYSWH